VVPALPNGSDVLVDPAARPIEPEVPVARPEVAATPEPAHGVEVLSGAGTPIMGLTPALSTSVAPRGIVPLRDDRTFVPGVDSGEAMPVEDIVPGDAEAQAPDVVAVPDVNIPDVIPVDPPPSKVELVPAVGDPVIWEAAPPEKDVPVPMQLELLAVEPSGIGLMPPGLISVAPNGIPVEDPGEVDPGMPNGDVAPIAGVFSVLCAYPIPQLNDIAIRTSGRRAIETSCLRTKTRVPNRVRDPCFGVDRAAAITTRPPRLPDSIETGCWDRDPSRQRHQA
jgi:hypothetical protein